MHMCLVGTSECLGSPIEYHLISHILEDGNESYGVMVRLGDEEESVYHVSPSKDNVQRLLHVMISGSVSPVSVRDIVEDWILQ